MADNGTTFAEAIRAGRTAFDAARDALPSLPVACDGVSRASTVEGALREQEERLAGLAAANKAPSKSRQQRDRHAPSEHVPPGYKIGVAAYTAPFWSLVEVCCPATSRPQNARMPLLCCSATLGGTLASGRSPARGDKGPKRAQPRLHTASAVPRCDCRSTRPAGA